jgi:uncharacterized protein (DUF2141 family)
MKAFTYGSAILAGFLGLVFEASAADLTVTVEGVHHAGKLILGLYNYPDQWPQGKALYKVSVPATEGNVVYIFKQLPPGHYALTGFHDENDNGKMDYSFIGLPEEGFFFSNDASPTFSTPKFDTCTIIITDAPAAITVHIQHW